MPIGDNWRKSGEDLVKLLDAQTTRMPPQSPPNSAPTSPRLIAVIPPTTVELTPALAAFALEFGWDFETISDEKVRTALMVALHQALLQKSAIEKLNEAVRLAHSKQHSALQEAIKIIMPNKKES